MLLSQALNYICEKYDTSTPTWYRNPVGQFIDEIGDVEASAVKPEDIAGWYSRCRERGLSRWTLNSYGRAMRAFWNQVVDEGHVTESPCRIKIVSVPPATPKDITDEELAKMIAVSRRSPRDHAIVLMLRDTGCRAGGLISMRASDVQQSGEGGKVMVVEKGDKTRFVFYKEEAAQALDVYMGTRPVYAPDALWLNRSDNPLTVRGLYSILKDLGQRAGVATFNPHAFRHRLCKKLVANGAPTKVIQDLMGWSSAAMIQMYAAHGVNELEEFHRRYT